MSHHQLAHDHKHPEGVAHPAQPLSFSLLRMSVGQRVLLAAFVSVLLWALIWIAA